MRTFLNKYGIITILILCIMTVGTMMFALNNTIEYYDYKIEELEHENLELVDIINKVIKNQGTIVNYMLEQEDHTHGKLK